MIIAILEILFLLTISCLIGIYFTYRFWKAKYAQLQDELREEKAEKDEINQQLNAEKEANLKLKEDLSQASQKAQEAEKSEKEEKEKNKQLTSDLEKSKKEIATLNDKLKKTKSSEEDKEKLKKLKGEMEVLNEQLDEKEREIAALFLELDKQKISYYKQINGKRYKAITLKMADESVSGQGDGRISKEDAEKIFATISDGKAYTQVEKDTMRYLRDNYKWTEGADELFRKKVRSWAAKGHQLN